jgi:hypothetical protein
MCDNRLEILLPRYAEESAADWQYVLENTDSDPSGCQNRLYRIADLAFKGTDLIHIHSGSAASSPSGDR